MSGADWFAKKLGPQGGTQRPSAAPVAPAVDGLRLRGPLVPQQASPVPQGAVQEATTGTITGKENYQQLSQAIEQQTGEAPTILKMSRNWKGGEAMRTEGHLRCPQCDSMNIFTRSNVKVMNENSGNMGHAKPRCFDCGWQEGYTPGDRGNWV